MATHDTTAAAAPTSPATAADEASGASQALPAPPVSWREVVQTVAIVLALLLAGEALFRAVVPRLSKNSRTLALAPERAARIAAANDATSILILGNSVSGDGIDADALAVGLRDAGHAVLVEHQPADSSAAVDWFYQLQNQYAAADAMPDVLLLPIGNPLPLTRVNPKTEDLLFSFLRVADLPEYLRASETRAFDAQLGVVAGKGVALYAFRGRFQKRALGTLVPGWVALRQAMMEPRSVSADASDAEPPAAPAQTSVWAERIDGLADASGTRVVVVAMPTEPLDGRVPVDASRVVSSLGWDALEPARGVAFTEEDRPDGLHLTPEAASRFTGLLIEAMVPVLGQRAVAEEE